ncbi:MAG: ligase-associated DNA damage response endonuclease PdeM, partial [Desulfobacterales bacterium]
WRERRILLIADPHFGKAASFRSMGIAVPSGTTRDDLNRLGALILKYQPEELVVLGDLIHSAKSKGSEILLQFEEWRTGFSDLKITLIKGNHDRLSGRPPAELRFDQIENATRIGSVMLSHKPSAHAGRYTIAGHIHPAVRLKGIGGQRETLPCFYFSRQYAMLPAFGSFTGNHIIKPSPQDQVYVIAGAEAIKVQPPLHVPL